MNQLTINTYLPMSVLEKKVLLICQKFSRLHIKKIFEQPSKNCLKFLKKRQSDVNIKNDSNLIDKDFNVVSNTASSVIPEAIDTPHLGFLNENKHKLSAVEQLFLSNYNLVMNDFGETNIKGIFSDYNHYL